jgi:multimeric flavodoxin WrbA
MKIVVDELNSLTGFDIIDLNDFNITYYDYEHKNESDDYLELMKKLIGSYDTFIFATPVYWYSMSGIMKVFFDRITDLLDIEKDLGRKLRNKNMAVITCSIGSHLGEIFWLPFSETAKYLGMNYVGNIHTLAGDINQDELKKFIQEINTEIERLSK